MQIVVVYLKYVEPVCYTYFLFRASQEIPRAPCCLVPRHQVSVMMKIYITAIKDETL